MTTLREAATQALEALEGGADSWQLVGPAIDALKEALVQDAMQKFTDVNQELEAALAEPPDSTKFAVEPIGWLEAPHGEFRFNTRLKHEFPPQSLNWRIPLYALAEPVQENKDA